VYKRQGLHDEEMGTEMKQMIFRLRKNNFYKKKFKDTFGCDTIELKHFVYAVASYERTLISANNYNFNHQVQTHLEPVEKNVQLGTELFFGKANCNKCHNGDLFTDFSIQNIGLYQWYDDPGLARVNNSPKDSGKFKTPTLLNIEYTAPYMHDGSIATLEEVVEFYNSGGKNHPNKSEFIKPLNLTKEEKKSLVIFLKNLTDEDLKNKTGIFKTPELKFE
jgi:cytochrome c peroxidase